MYCKECYKKINESDAKNRMKKYREKKKKNVTFQKIELYNFKLRL